jgi:hypothetical protein
VWAKAQTTLALLTQTWLKSLISGQTRNKARFCPLDGFLGSVSNCYISEHQGWSNFFYGKVREIIKYRQQTNFCNCDCMFILQEGKLNESLFSRGFIKEW